MVIEAVVQIDQSLDIARMIEMAVCYYNRIDVRNGESFPIQLSHEVDSRINCSSVTSPR